MSEPIDLGQIVVLNGVSRAGKSTLATALQESLPGVWIHLGVDAHMACTPPCRQPGVGLRPGRDQVSPEIEECVPVLYAALYESVAAHSRLGLNVTHHDAYTVPRRILYDYARRMTGLPVLFVGVHCPIDVIWARRQATWGQERGSADVGVVAAVELAQRATYAHGCYDLELDTSLSSTKECVEVIARRLAEGPAGSAFPTVAGGGLV